jgi:hypothetical protein
LKFADHGDEIKIILFDWSFESSEGLPMSGLDMARQVLETEVIFNFSKFYSVNLCWNFFLFALSFQSARRCLG